MTVDDLIAQLLEYRAAGYGGDPVRVQTPRGLMEIANCDDEVLMDESKVVTILLVTP